ncbi:translation initiation factor 2 [Phytohabitans rumicis]|uniref:translation initiation factor 2 n=1 Tax=Phytohabitans rumicis TaxID=1076125 RepID=UPI001567189A|nr:translation initiation factor 2 [Phytohabitans rumicis]
MTTRSGGLADDEFWRHTANGAEPTQAGSAEPPSAAGSAEPVRPVPPAQPVYPGPPTATPPPLGWRPPVVLQPPTPRRLPGQDMAGVEAEERSARTLTYGIGMIAAAVLMIVVCLLCSRLLF